MEFKRLAATLIVAAGVVAGCGAQAPADTASVPGGRSVGGEQVSDEGGVTVKVTWAGPDSGASFEVAMDTHSVDLDGLDLRDAVLRNDRGDQLSAEPWTAPKGGHHREGTLSFGGDVRAVLDRASWIEVVLRGVAGVPERVLRWQVGT